MTNTLVYAFFGAAMIMGLRQMRDRVAVIWFNLNRPRPPAHERIHPMDLEMLAEMEKERLRAAQRDYCIGCGQLARSDTMSWSGSNLLCPVCTDRERV